MELAWLEVCGIDCQRHLEAGEKQFRRFAIYIAIALPVLLALSWYASGTDNPASLLRRGAYGDPERTVTLTGTLTAGEDTLEKEFQVEVKNSPLEEEVAFALFDQCSQWLSETWFATGKVCGDLELPDTFGDGLVSIVWESSDPARIGSDGQVNLLNAPSPCAVVLTAVLSAGSYSMREEFVVTLGDDGTGYMSSLERYAEALETELNASTEGEYLKLPEADGQIQLDWTLPRRQPAWLLVPLSVLVVVCLYVMPFESLTTILKRRREAFQKEIPSFTLQLILLLNAGLVPDSAISRLLEHSDGSEGPLYGAVRTLWEKSKAQNLSFFTELYVFARRTGMRDFIRLAAILHDNSVHGNELVSRLEKERELLWNDRLSAAKARAKQVDTKLCFPLMLLLLSLVLLAACPAFLNM